MNPVVIAAAAYLVVVNLIAFAVYGADKRRAKKDKRRVPEKTLFLLALIGGSVGLDAALKQKADLRLSMSPMTFPHHMARVMLLEQIYRAYQISDGTRYHK